MPTLDVSVPGRRRLATRRGDYWLRHFDLWKHREQVEPVAQVLTEGARICMLGSCFAGHSAGYLATRGYAVTTHPAGELYNPHIIRLELEHVLAGTPWPDNPVVEVPGGVTHRFRKRCSAPTADELLALDRRMTEEIHAALTEADVILVVVGTTAEFWRDGETGLATNEIPHPAAFDDERWRLDLGTVADVVQEIQAIQALIRGHTKATGVFAVCPIPLYATWDHWPVVRANGRNKALLRMALESLPPDAVYLDLWDWMLAQTQGWSPTKRDGRHFDQLGIARIMRFAELRLGARPPMPTRREELRTGMRDLRVRYREGRSPRDDARRVAPSLH